MLSYHRQLIALRHAFSALQTGAYIPLYAEGNVYIFARVLAEEQLIIAVNVGSETEQIVCSIPAEKIKLRSLIQRFGEAHVSWTDTGDPVQRLVMTLPPRAGSILSV